MKCFGTFINGLFARTAELNSGVVSKSLSTNSIVFTAKLQERESRKNSKNNDLMFYSKSQ